MDAKETLRQMHRGVRYMFENSIKSVFSYEQMKDRVDDKGNSIAWLMWHMARTEDVVVSSLVQDIPQVLISGDWLPKLGIEEEHIGTGLGDDDVAEFTKKMNVEAVDDYWSAVAKASFHWLKGTEEADLDVVPDFGPRLAAIPPIIAGGANEMAATVWEGRTAGQLFMSVVIGHGYIHIGQMQEIGGRLGTVGWF
ncbi:MAG: DinB family protein [Actinobacteria bacterium]|nr:DinB family protein [Actinomycetota bacterium]